MRITRKNEAHIMMVGILVGIELLFSVLWLWGWFAENRNHLPLLYIMAGVLMTLFLLSLVRFAIVRYQSAEW